MEWNRLNELDLVAYEEYLLRIEDDEYEEDVVE